MTQDCDFLVIGAGIAGTSVAYELARVTAARVVVLERESMPGYHTTGRSAAHFTGTNGPPSFRALAQAGLPFFENPPEGFADQALLSPRGKLHVARADQREDIERFYAGCRDLGPDIRLIDGPEAIAINPALDPDYVVAAVHQPSMDIDVHALHQGYIRGLKALGGTLLTNAEVTQLDRAGGQWHVQSAAGVFSSPVVIDAAGAWADEIAAAAGLKPLGLVPKRRTVIQFDPPPDIDCRDWPQTLDVGETFYFKPDAGRIFACPADETPSPPCDAQPEELDMAMAVERIETATTLKVAAITHKWAGLRSFFSDKLPAIGFDPRAEGFFWLAGQGGYGIKTSYGMARTAVALATGTGLPVDLLDLGLRIPDVTPDRLL